MGKEAAAAPQQSPGLGSTHGCVTSPESLASPRDGMGWDRFGVIAVTAQDLLWVWEGGQEGWLSEGARKQGASARCKHGVCFEEDFKKLQRSKPCLSNAERSWR